MTTMTNNCSNSAPRKACLLALALLFSSALRVQCERDDNDSSSARFLRQRRNSSNVVCRVTVEDTLLEDETQLKSESVQMCSPIVNDQQLGVDTVVELPLDISEQYQQQIALGTLIVSISDATLDSYGSILLGSSPSYTVLEDSRLDRHRQRHLNDLMDPFGTKTVTIVRISTTSHQQENENSDIEETIFGGGTSFVTQIEDCSFGKLKFIKSERGVFNLQLPGENSDYDGDATKLVTAAQKELLDQGYGPGSELSDRTIFCLPEGSGDWAARAGMNHWRITMNHGWCLSLSAAMHEMGHTMGLGHADEMGGYMGASYRKHDWPRKCYNGYNNHHIGWYNDRTVEWKNDMTSIKLATFVDYPLTSPDEAVIVTMEDKYFVQFNVKKSFNAHPDNFGEEGEGKVEIHESLPAEDTKLIASLAIGERVHLSDHDVYVMACESYLLEGGAEGMFISFAKRTSDLCKDELTFGEGRDVVQSEEEEDDNNDENTDNADQSDGGGKMAKNPRRKTIHNPTNTITTITSNSLRKKIMIVPDNLKSRTTKRRTMARTASLTIFRKMETSKRMILRLSLLSTSKPWLRKLWRPS